MSFSDTKQIIVTHSVDYKLRTSILSLLLFGSKRESTEDLPHTEGPLHDMTKLVPDFSAKGKAVFDQNDIIHIVN